MLKMSLLNTVVLALCAVIPTQAQSDGDLRFHQASFIVSHNAHATLAVAEGMLEPLGTNQENSILEQLALDGVRGLMLDVALNAEEDEPLRLVHESSFITLDYGAMRNTLGANLIPFLEDDENENAIVSFFLEIRDNNDSIVRETILQQLKDIFASMTINGVSLKDMLFKYDDARWEDHTDWPTLDEIRSSGQRIFVFTDRSEYAEDKEFAFMHNRNVLKENNWEGITVCEARYMWGEDRVSLPNNEYWTRLFFMNHFSGGSGPDAGANVIGENLVGGGNNGWGILYRRIQDCMGNNGGYKPNFISLDWIDQSQDAREVRDFLNFGGRIGTGQKCVSDSQCATLQCNQKLGICQCQECPSDSTGTCLGCDSGQYCVSEGEQTTNICLDKVGGDSSIESTPTETQGTVNEDVAAPTQTPTDYIAENSFYCGLEYFETVKGCNEAVVSKMGFFLFIFFITALRNLHSLLPLRNVPGETMTAQRDRLALLALTVLALPRYHQAASHQNCPLLFHRLQVQPYLLVQPLKAKQYTQMPSHHIVELISLTH